MTKKQAPTQPSSILDYFQAQADTLSALLRAPGGGELMAEKQEEKPTDGRNSGPQNNQLKPAAAKTQPRAFAKQTKWDDELDALLVKFERERLAFVEEQKRQRAAEREERWRRRVAFLHEQQQAAERKARATVAPNEAANRPLRRKKGIHVWAEIHAEIAAYCIDPKTRHVVVPKTESKVAERVLQWCVNTDRPQPSVSEVREAVRIICARLREI